MSLPVPFFSVPLNTGVYTLTGGGRSVVLPSTVNSDDEQIKGVTYHEQIAGKDGLFSTRNPSLGGKNIGLSGLVLDSDTLSDIKKVLSFKRNTLIRGGLYLTVDLVSFGVEKIAPDVWRVAMDFESPNYFWEAATETTTSGSPASVTNAGDVSVFPVIDVTAGVGGFTVATFVINSKTATYTGSVAEGGVLVIDCSQLTGTVDGVNALNNMNSSFFVNPPVLVPGANAINATLTGTATYEVKHTGRFL